MPPEAILGETATPNPGANGSVAGDPAGSATAGGSNGSQPATWYSTAAGFSDEDKSFIETKGWKEGPQNLLKSYRNLEQLMGAKANAVLLPKADDPEGSQKFFREHFGVPDKPDDYKLPADMSEEDAKALNPQLMSFYKTAAHKHNMTPAQFQGFMKDYNAEVAKAEEAETTTFNAEVGKVKQRLEQEFGKEYGEQVARGNLAMTKLGLNKDEVVGLAEAIGTERATRLLMQIGGMLAQDKVVGMDGKGTQSGFVTDKAKAQDNIGRITRGDDPNFKKAMLDSRHPDHKNVITQWREWQRAANS